MSERLPTGITILDRQLEGGIPRGSIVLLSAPPASQSELFLYELTAARGTLYLTTIRSDQAVNDALGRVGTNVGNPTVRDVGGEASLDKANRLIGTLPEGANLIIDAIDPLEQEDPGRFRMFLNELQTTMVNTGGVAILHGMKGRRTAENRDLTEHVADLVFDLRTEVLSGEIENKLIVPKFRGGKALDEPIKLKLRDEVAVDTSRDIA